MDNVVELLPRAEREEVEEMRQQLLKVDSDRDAMARIAFLAERIARRLTPVLPLQPRVAGWTLFSP